MVMRAALLHMANSKKMESFVRRNRWSAGTARRFVAGETIEEAIEPVRALNLQGITASLDLLGESVTNEQEVAEVLDTYLCVFQTIRDQALQANVSVKLTALGLDLDYDLCYRNMVRLLNAANSLHHPPAAGATEAQRKQGEERENEDRKNRGEESLTSSPSHPLTLSSFQPDPFVRIDMESSDYTQRTLDLFYRLWEESYRNVGVVIQSYLRRSEDDVEKLIQTGARVRLCKGAYKEPESVAFPDKSEVDANYIRLMQRLLKDGNYPGIATHDEKMIAATRLFAKENDIPPDRYEFQMLYGIRRDLQTQLVKEGYRMRVYTPFGTHWYPYLMRRLAERPANLWFVAKNMLRS
jgi:proline dehydrogenase